MPYLLKDRNIKPKKQEIQTWKQKIYTKDLLPRFRIIFYFVLPQYLVRRIENSTWRNFITILEVFYERKGYNIGKVKQRKKQKKRDLR